MPVEANYTCGHSFPVLPWAALSTECPECEVGRLIMPKELGCPVLCDPNRIQVGRMCTDAESAFFRRALESTRSTKFPKWRIDLTHQDDLGMKMRLTPVQDDQLPPVGANQNDFVPSTCISAAGADDPLSTWEVVAHFMGKAVVCFQERGDGRYRCALVEPEHCRPVHDRQEREAVVQMAGEATDKLAGRKTKEVLEHLYDIGMLRKPEDT